MRITNSMMTANYLTGLNRNLSQMSKYQDQIALNRRITKLSDDPVGVISSLSVRTKLNDLEQYQSNIDDAQTWLTQSETAIMDLDEVIQSAYEQALQAANGTQGASDKAAIATAIQQLREHVVQVGNSTLNDKYIFGGYNTTSAPFADTGSGVTYQGIDLLTATQAQVDALDGQTIEYEIGSSLRTTVSLTGTQVMGTGDKNLVGILDGLINVLNSDGTAAQISAYVTKLQGKQDDILALAADIGGRTNRLDMVTSRYSQDGVNYETMKSNVEDVDTAEVIMRLKTAEAVYNAALSIGSKVIQPSLTDFLS